MFRQQIFGGAVAHPAPLVPTPMDKELKSLTDDDEIYRVLRN